MSVNMNSNNSKTMIQQNSHFARGVFIYCLLIGAMYQTAAAETRNQAHHREDAYARRNEQQNNSYNGGGVNSIVSDMFLKALREGYQKSLEIAQEKKKEHSALRPPSQAKYSSAKTFVSGKTLYMNNSDPIWFDSNGYGASLGKSGVPKLFKWLVKSDMVCMGSQINNRNCIRFIFNKKNTSIQTSSGGLVNTFQLLGDDIENLSKYTNKRQVAKNTTQRARK